VEFIIIIIIIITPIISSVITLACIIIIIIIIIDTKLQMGFVRWQSDYMTECKTTWQKRAVRSYLRDVWPCRMNLGVHNWLHGAELFLRSLPLSGYSWVSQVYGTQRLITVYKGALHRSVFRARSIQSIPPHPILFTYVLLSSILAFPLVSYLYNSAFILATFPVHHILPDWWF
jgi:hypothetical protein